MGDKIPTRVAAKIKGQIGRGKEGEEKREIADFICLRVTGKQASRQAVKGNKAAFASFPPTAPYEIFNILLLSDPSLQMNQEETHAKEAFI